MQVGVAMEKEARSLWQAGQVEEATPGEDENSVGMVGSQHLESISDLTLFLSHTFEPTISYNTCFSYCTCFFWLLPMNLTLII